MFFFCSSQAILDSTHDNYKSVAVGQTTLPVGAPQVAMMSPSIIGNQAPVLASSQGIPVMMPQQTIAHAAPLVSPPLQQAPATSFAAPMAATQQVRDREAPLFFVVEIHSLSVFGNLLW